MMLSIDPYLNLIHEVVWKYVHQTSFLEFDDLVSEAYISCLEALPHYNPKKGKPTTFIYTVVNNRMKDFLKKAYKYEVAVTLSPDLEAQLTTTEPSPEHILSAEERWAQKFAQLSPEAQYICRLALKPRRYMSTDTPMKYKRTLMKVLQKQGWRKSQIKRGFLEIKEVFRT